jgi:hypothetical protein
MSCTKCGGSGVIDTGNGDFPCECSAGASAKFNVSGTTSALGSRGST